MKRKRIRPTQAVDKLLAIHAFMVKYHKKNKIYPSSREIRDEGLASSTSVVSGCFEAMEKLKMVEHNPVKSRATIPLPLNKVVKEVRDFIKEMESKI